ncbi:MAG: hypothetical protein FIA99_19280 [Ruminiclostridium sp.]|nr:hypothetical protein [Ruminiclostridium sp.]
MSKKIKTLISVIVTIMLISGIAACGTKTGTNSQQSSQSQTAAETSESTNAEKIEISIALGGRPAAVDPDTWAEKKVEEKLNIDIVVNPVDITNSDQVNLMMASGEMPDAGWFLQSSKKLYSDGLTRTIKKDMIVKNAPDYAALLDKNPLGWKISRLGTTDEYMALTGYYPLLSEGVAYSSFYRLDWLEKLGIKPHGNLEQIDANGKIFITDEAFTQDEFVNIMKAFTQNDPDGNGKNDTIGMSGNVYKNYTWMPLAGMYGISLFSGLDGTASVEENGKASYSISSQAYKDFLKFAASLYKQGLIDKEFPTVDWNKWTEKLTNGKAGYFATTLLYLNDIYYKDRAPLSIIEANPAAKILIAPPEKGSGGKQGSMPYTFVPFNYSFFVNRQVDDNKLAKIIQLFNYCYFDKEARVYLKYGEEGTDFTWSGEPYKSFVVIKINDDERAKKGLSKFNSENILLIEDQVFSQGSMFSKVFDGYTSTKWKDMKYQPYRYDLFNATNINDMTKEKGGAINTIVDEFFLNSITGAVDIDAKWDEYIDNLNKAGLSGFVDELNKAPLFSDIMAGK